MGIPEQRGSKSVGGFSSIRIPILIPATPGAPAPTWCAWITASKPPRTKRSERRFWSCGPWRAPPRRSDQLDHVRAEEKPFLGSGYPVAQWHPTFCLPFFWRGSPLNSTNQKRMPFFPMAIGHLSYGGTHKFSNVLECWTSLGGGASFPNSQTSARGS